MIVENLITLLNSYTGEFTEERISNEERFNALSEGVSKFKQTLKSDMSNMTYNLDFLPGINYYKTNNVIANLLGAGDVRVTGNVTGYERSELPFGFTSSERIAEMIGRDDYVRPEYAIDRHDGDAYLAINFENGKQVLRLHEFNEIEDITLSSDATNATVDKLENTQGSGALRFTIDTSASVDDSATISFPLTTNLETLENNGYFIFTVNIPDVSDITSVSFKVGSDASNYLIGVATNSYMETGFKNGLNRIVIKWSDLIKIGTPDLSNISFGEITINYNPTQVDMSVMIDNFYVTIPTKLVFHYVSYSVGRDASGNEISEFSDVSDIPFISGQYEAAKYTIARQAASILFGGALRLFDESVFHQRQAEKEMEKIRHLIPSSFRSENKAFKPAGVSFKRRGARRIN